MVKKTTTLEDLKQETAEAAPVAPRTPKKDALGRSQSVGKKKNAIARVIIKLGSGKITVNGRSVENYFPRPVLQMIINQPFAVTNREGQFDVQCNVCGGGLSGQAGAIRHGIARAIVKADESLKSEIKKAGFLTRDSRVKERKKYGLKKARKAPQFRKR